MSKTKVAIACQGGGSQTAFTAGVLSAFFENNVHLDRQIVSFSGTSGGAVCASLAWYGMLRAARGDRSPIQDRIKGFWETIIAQMPPEVYLDTSATELLRMIDKGILPHLELSPVSMFCQMAFSAVSSFLPRRFFTDLKAALEAHINFAEIPHLVEPSSPVLLLGAVDVLSGQLKKFNSRDGEIRVEAILASAAIPNLFPAVEIDGRSYWDGLFSDNPPVKELLRPLYVGSENIPDEIWVIQINPIEIDKVPQSPSEIIDRRNELMGNVSLLQSLEYVDLVNLLIRTGSLAFEVLERYGFKRRDPIDVRFIRMSPELQSTLDYVSKLTREPSHIHRLMADGETQGRAFLESLPRSRPARTRSTPRGRRGKRVKD